MLDSHPHISCGPETHFLSGFEQLLNRWNTLRRYGFDQEYWYEKIAAFFDEFQQDYAVRRGKQRWADKTPAYSLHLDFIDKVFPSSQVVHIIRDGRDVVASHRSSWGYKPAVGAADKWRRFVTGARAAGRQLGESRYHEVRYEDLVAEPERALRTLLDFLGEPWDDAVLAYDRADHDVYETYADETQSHREADRDPALVYRSSVRHGQDLDPVLRVIFWLRAGRLARSLGY